MAGAILVRTVYRHSFKPENRSPEAIKLLAENPAVLLAGCNMVYSCLSLRSGVEQRLREVPPPLFLFLAVWAAQSVGTVVVRWKI